MWQMLLFFPFLCVSRLENTCETCCRECTTGMPAPMLDPPTAMCVGKPSQVLHLMAFLVKVSCVFDFAWQVGTFNSVGHSQLSCGHLWPFLWRWVCVSIFAWQVGTSTMKDIPDCLMAIHAYSCEVELCMCLCMTSGDFQQYTCRIIFICLMANHGHSCDGEACMYFCMTSGDFQQCRISSIDNCLMATLVMLSCVCVFAWQLGTLKH